MRKQVEISRPATRGSAEWQSHHRARIRGTNGQRRFPLAVLNPEPNRRSTCPGKSLEALPGR